MEHLKGFNPTGGFYDMAHGVLDTKSPADGFFSFFLTVISDPVPGLTAGPLEQTIDMARRRVKITMNESLLKGKYNWLTATITFTTKEDGGGQVEWIFTYKMTKRGTEAPHEIINTLTDLLEKADKNFFDFGPSN